SRLIRRSVRTRHLYALHGFYDYLQERRTLQGRVAPATLTPYLHPLEHLTSAALIRAILTKQTLHSPLPYSGNDKHLNMANLPTDMELELASTQQTLSRTPSPQPQLTPCEQLKFNKAQLAKMEAFRKCKQACVDTLKQMPDHYPDEPFYQRSTDGTTGHRGDNGCRGSPAIDIKSTPPRTGKRKYWRRIIRPIRAQLKINFLPPIMLFIEEDVNYKVQMAAT
ncbi:hypothetical protein TNCV_2844661, partial [Trichonephila clavipes]